MSSLAKLLASPGADPIDYCYGTVTAVGPLMVLVDAEATAVATASAPSVVLKVGARVLVLTRGADRVVVAGIGRTSWSTWASTISAAVGVITTSSSVCRYVVVGTTCHWTAEITITTNGTGAVVILFTLPTDAPAASKYLGSGREAMVTGSMLAVTAYGAGAAVQTYNNAYPAGNGYRLDLAGTYEIQI